MISHAIKLVMTACMLAFLTACSGTSTIEADTDFDSSFDFSNVKRINLQSPRRADAPQDILLSDMQINRIEDALADELESRGFVIVVGDDPADLLLSWHLVTQEQTDVRTYDSMSRYNCWRCGPSVSEVSVRHYTEGTLIVDMIDPSRDKSVWRAIVEERLKPKAGELEAATRRKEAARAIFSGFPPNGVPAT